MSPQSDTSWSQEGDILVCERALLASSDSKSVTYIFAPRKPEKDVMVTVGKTVIQADIFIGEGKQGFEEVDKNPPEVGPPSLHPRVNQKTLEDRDKQKTLKKVGRKKELRPITGLLNDDMVLEKPISARKLLRSNMITISELNLLA